MSSSASHGAGRAERAQRSRRRWRARCNAHPVRFWLGLLRRLLQRHHLRRSAPRQRRKRAAGGPAGRKASEWPCQPPAAARRAAAHQVEHVVVLEEAVLGRRLLRQVRLQRRNGGRHLERERARPLSAGNAANEGARRRTCAASSGDAPFAVAAEDMACCRVVPDKGLKMAEWSFFLTRRALLSPQQAWRSLRAPRACSASPFAQRWQQKMTRCRRRAAPSATGAP